MSYGGPLLSDLELRYPFAPRSRKFFESIPVEDGLASREVIGQTESRLLSALGRAKYEPHISELVEFSSFFAAALVASQDPVLTSKFSKKEAERAKEFFVREEPRAKVEIMAECFGGRPSLVNAPDGRASYSMTFERYLSLVSRYELARNSKWKLARQELDLGTVYLSENMLNDLFGDSALTALDSGVSYMASPLFAMPMKGWMREEIQLET